jgi:hypothetical protein
MAKQHKLTIADAHLQVIIAALAEKPYRVAQPILQSIMVQVQAAEKQPPEGFNTPGPDPYANSQAAIDYEKRAKEIAAETNGHDKKAPLI